MRSARSPSKESRASSPVKKSHVKKKKKRRGKSTESSTSSDTSTSSAQRKHPSAQSKSPRTPEKSRRMYRPWVRVLQEVPLSEKLKSWEMSGVFRVVDGDRLGCRTCMKACDQQSDSDSEDEVTTPVGPAKKQKRGSLEKGSLQPGKHTLNIRL